jgi:hypothetical protein
MNVDAWGSQGGGHRAWDSFGGSDILHRGQFIG